VTGVASPVLRGGIVEGAVSAMWTDDRRPATAARAIKQLAAHIAAGLI